MSTDNVLIHRTALVESRDIGSGTRIWAFAHVLERAVIGRNCNIGDHCFVEGGARVGNDVVIKNGVSVWSGVHIEDHAFVGPNVAFTNDRHPRAKAYRHEYDRTLIREGASLGANVTLLSPLTIGRYATIGAGTVVTHDVADFGLVYGNPGRLVGFVCRCGARLPFVLDQDARVTCACGLAYEKRALFVHEAGFSGQRTGSNHGSSPQKIPFVDLRPQHDELRAELDAVIRDVIEKSAFIGGSYVEDFERDFAAFCGTRHAVACASGTDALKLALMAADVRPGEEVITVPHTFIATIEAITLIGAHPALVDIDRETQTLSPCKLGEFLESGCRAGEDGHPINRKTGRRVSAILPVHLYGLPADMQAIGELARRHHLKVIEDACQAHGAGYQLDGSHKRAGALGDAAAFSFYPGKNLGAMGEGGAVTTSEDIMSQNMRVWRDHGQIRRYFHVSASGWNGRLDGMQCAILGVKLRKLEEWNERRRQAARWYCQRLGTEDRIILPREVAGSRHVYHLFVVRVADRDRLHQQLSVAGIGVGLHYPVPLHLQDAYRDRGWNKGDFPESEAAAASVLSLPIYPHITEAQVDHVCKTLKDALS